MAKYVIAYHGGSKPESKEAGMKLMTDWQNWVNNMGTALIDPGNGVGMSKTVMNDGTVVDNGGSNPIFGYSLISADSMEEALGKLKNHPFLAHLGGSIEIAQAMEHN